MIKKGNIIRGGIFVLMIFLLAGAGTAVSQEFPLQVLSATPRGSVEGYGEFNEITVIFNQPMVPLAKLPEGLGSGPLVLEPIIKGKYRWMGTSTLAFTPSETFPLCTGFKATVPAGTKSMSGQVLKQDYTWSFETLRPKVVQHSPHHGQQWVRLDQEIWVLFNQAIVPRLVWENAVLEKSNSSPADIQQGRNIMTVSCRNPSNKEWKKAGNGSLPRTG